MQFEKTEQKNARPLRIRSFDEIPELYSNIRVKDPVAYVRFHASWANASWYVFEWNGGDTFFGMKAQGKLSTRSYGLYSLEALGALRGPHDMPVVQDYGFRPTKMSQLRKKELERVWGRER